MSVSFQLLSLNSYIFPPLYSYVASSLGHEAERVQAIATKILDLNQKPDVICLQEMWSNQKENQFYDKIQSEYPYRFRDDYFHPLYLGSGLVIYSKHPIVKTQKVYFEHYRGHENFCNKGFLMAKIIKDKTPLNVVTTHLQAGGNAIDNYLGPYSSMPTQEIAFNQMKQINDAITSFALPLEPTFIAGDFNITQHDPSEYPHIKEALPTFEDTVDGSLNLSGTSQGKKGYRENYIIDYILNAGQTVKGATQIIGDIDNTLSDHLALLGTFEVETTEDAPSNI